jgi:biotin carboxyl carrier protein
MDKTDNTKTGKIETKLIALGENKVEYEFTVKDDYEYSYKKQDVKIELIEEADGFTILSCMGVRYPVEILSHRQNTYEILVNGVGYSFSIETPFSLSRKKMLFSKEPPLKTMVIRAPMPGKILDIMVESGQTVNSGEALLVLEAMKMQNTITSLAKGIVSKVVVKPGINVGKDDVLIEIERI